MLRHEPNQSQNGNARLYTLSLDMATVDTFMSFPGSFHFFFPLLLGIDAVLFYAIVAMAYNSVI